MKRVLAILMFLVLMISSACAEGTAMGNPWVDTTAEEIAAQLGLAFNVPGDAGDVLFRMMPEEGMAEMDFTMNGTAFTARICPAREWTDISGLYYDWTDPESASVGTCAGRLEQAADGNDHVMRLLWFDAASGLMYSLSATGTDLNGLDPEALAAMIYVPAASGETGFADLAGYSFWFSSGVGGWHTVLIMGEDGCFTGEFSDSEMGDSGEGYPNGTVYGCTFHGRLSLAGQLNDYTLILAIDSLELDEGQAPEAIEDGIRYITVEKPYGLENARQLLLYLPGAPVSELPEGFLSWSHLYYEEDKVDELPFYGLYNETDECGFVGEFGD